MARETPELWVHPVTHGAEATSDRLAVWRFRLVLLVLLLGVAALFFLVISHLQGGTDSPASGLHGPLVQRVLEHL